jgi:pimeloyl-ACP methyl ester carboxylesterase
VLGGGACRPPLRQRRPRAGRPGGGGQHRLPERPPPRHGRLHPELPLASTALEYNLLFFADRGYWAIALDQRGFGRSDAPYRPVQLRRVGHDIRTVLEAGSKL